MDIVISGLTKSFGGEKVLAGFSAVFEGGKKYCVTGRSESGKTTSFFSSSCSNCPKKCRARRNRWIW